MPPISRKRRAKKREKKVANLEPPPVLTEDQFSLVTGMVRELGKTGIMPRQIRAGVDRIIDDSRVS